MNKFFWLFTILLCCQLAFSQNSTTYQVYFKSDESVLDAEDQTYLDNLITQCKNAGYYELYLTAHTDADGGYAYNNELSKARADAVIAYLVSKNVPREILMYDTYGEGKPVQTNSTEIGKSANRRVEIEARTYSFKNGNDVLNSTVQNAVQHYTLNGNGPASIVSERGTKIDIPSDALQTKDGKKVNLDKVVVSLQEYYKPMEAIAKKLSTQTTDGKLLQSGGMFNLSASLNGEALEIRQGAKLDVTIPGEALQKDMTVFVAKTNNSGVTEWVNTNVSFVKTEPVDLSKLYVNIDEELLRSRLQPQGELQKIAGAGTVRIPVMPSQLKAPGRPKLVLHKEKTQLKGWRKWFRSKSKEAEIRKLNARKQERYQKELEKYQARMQVYNKAMEKYRQDSLQFALEKKALRDQLKEMAASYTANAEEIERTSFNNMLKSMIQRSAANELRSNDLENQLRNHLMTDEKKLREYRTLKFYANQLNYISELPIDKIRKEFSKDGQLMLKKQGTYEGSRFEVAFNRRHLMEYYGNYANKFMNEDTVLRNHLRRKSIEFFDKRAELGMLDKESMRSIYRAQISAFGTINCDRFVETPQNLMVKVEWDRNANTSCSTSVFVKAYNSFLYPYIDPNSGKYCVNLPKGSQVALVTSGVQDGKPLFSVVNYRVEKGKSPEIQPKVTTIKEIERQLASL